MSTRSTEVPLLAISQTQSSSVFFLPNSPFISITSWFLCEHKHFCHTQTYLTTSDVRTGATTSSLVDELTFYVTHILLITLLTLWIHPQSTLNSEYSLSIRSTSPHLDVCPHQSESGVVQIPLTPRLSHLGP